MSTEAPRGSRTQHSHQHLAPPDASVRPAAIGRRAVLGAGALAAISGAGLATLATGQPANGATAKDAASTSAPTSAPRATSNRPGMLVSAKELTTVAHRVASGAAPWKAGWDRLTANPHSQWTWKPNPQAVIYRGAGTPDNVRILYHDVAAAFQNALRYRISGDVRNGDTARGILNAWSATLTRVDGNADRFLAAGLHGYQFANAAELMIGYPGFDHDRFATMQRNVFHAVSEDFLTHHNGAYDSNYWCSWDLLSLCCVMATGILTNDHTMIKRAATYLTTGNGLGALPNGSPHVYDDGTAQWVEVGRDQGHALLSIGLLGTLCEMAWHQGIDLYGALDNRVMRVAEYTAKWNNGQNVPWTTWTWHYGAPNIWGGYQTLTAPSPASRGQVRPVWATLANHYAHRRKMHVPNIVALAHSVAPEGGGGDYGEGGGFDHLGFGTLLYGYP